MSESTIEKRAYPHPTVRADWLAKVREDIIEPESPIIDPHHHLWHDRPSGRYKLEDLVADLTSGHNVVAAVFLQCGWMHRKNGPVDFRSVGETEVVDAVTVLSASGHTATNRTDPGGDHRRNSVHPRWRA